MVSGLLAVAFLFFVFAQAAVVRHEAQSAADAAALAAAQEASEYLRDDLMGAVEGDQDLGDILDGSGFEIGAACDEAGRLAEANGATLDGCDISGGGAGFTVSVVTQDTVGDSLIPGTENESAHAEATAVIHGLCELNSEDDDQDQDQIELDCEDSDDISIDPEDDSALPDARDLFLVYLDD